MQSGRQRLLYDLNGNRESGGGHYTLWTAWNMPLILSSGGQITTWQYTPEHDRNLMQTAGRSTWYLNPGLHQGGHYEQTKYSNGTIEHRHTLYGGGASIGEILSFSVPSGSAPAKGAALFRPAWAWSGG